jgi:nitroreductase
MDFADVVRSRRMVRAYQPDRPVPEVVLDRLLQTAVRAPSAGFSQGWDFVVCRRPADVAAFWEATTDPDAEPDAWLRGLRTAPVLVVCLSDPERYLRRYAEPDKGWDEDERERRLAHWPVPYWDVDTGMAALLMLLTAVDEGLGACFFGVPPERHAALLEALQAPPDRRVVGVVGLGHAAPDRRSPSLRRGRRPVGETGHDGRFGVPWRLRSPA